MFMKLLKKVLGGVITKRSAPRTTQNDALEIPKEKSLIIEREQIENTPFWALRIENGWFLALGDNRLTPPYKTKKECIEHLDKHKWQVIMQVALIMSKVKQKENLN